MLSPGEIAKIRADIERLEKARDQCSDTGIRQLIEVLNQGAKAEVGVRQEFEVARYHFRPAA
jgi:hypothetical protein